MPLGRHAHFCSMFRYFQNKLNINRRTQVKTYKFYHLMKENALLFEMRILKISNNTYFPNDMPLNFVNCAIF